MVNFILFSVVDQLCQVLIMLNSLIHPIPGRGHRMQLSIQEASTTYHGILYPNMDFCPKACSDMKINTINTAREIDWIDNQVRFDFRKTIPVSRVILSYAFITLVA